MLAIRAASAYDGATFVDDGVTVLVDDGLIVGVEGPHHEPPAGCPLATYDGTLLPGLVDTHVHLVADGTVDGLERAPTLSDDELDAVIATALAHHAAAGVTTVRDLGDCGYRTLPFRDREAPGVPRVVCAGPPVTVPDGHCHYLGGAAEGEAGVEAAVRERVERGVDIVKVMASGGMLTLGSDVLGVQFTPDELALAVRLTHAAGAAAGRPRPLPGRGSHALAAGVDGIEHFSCITERGVHTPDDLLEQHVVRGTVVGPTLGTDYDQPLPPELMPPQIQALVARLGFGPEEMIRSRTAQWAGARPRCRRGQWHRRGRRTSQGPRVPVACGAATDRGRLRPRRGARDGHLGRGRRLWPPRGHRQPRPRVGRRPARDRDRRAPGAGGAVATGRRVGRGERVVGA